MSTPQPHDDDALGGVMTENVGEATLSAPREQAVVTRGSALGRYVVLDRLGAGGMGVVFSAYDPELDRKVAIKVMHAHARTPKATGGRGRLLREAQAMAKLSHPNVIAVYDVGTIGDDVFLAMEFIAGRTLRAWLADKRPDWRETLRLFVEAGRGLAAAHAAGMVHRDFKPENVMIDDHGRARVLDFGLARPARDSVVSTDEAPAASVVAPRLTATGAVMGTPFYMAPEQHRSDPVDERADQFSFCVALWEALYGARPFAGASLPEVARSVLAGEREEPPRVPGIPPSVRRAIERGLAIDAADRFPTMDDLLAELGRDAGARKRLLALGAAIVLLPTAAVVAALLVSRTDPPCRDLDAAIRAIWNDATREQMRQAFAGVARVDVETTFETTAAALDVYVEEWAAERVEACEATRVRNEQSEQMLEMRYACLDNRAYRVELLLEVLSQPTQENVFASLSLVQQLPPVSDCRDVSRLRVLAPIPNDPETAASVQSIRRRIAHAEALGISGRIDLAGEELRALVDEVRAIGYPPLLGDVLEHQARIAMYAGEMEESEQAFEEAQLIAEAQGYDALLVRTHAELAIFYSTRKTELTLAHRHLRLAAAVLERMGDPPRLRMGLHLSEARVFMTEGNDVQAIEAFERHLASARDQGRENEAGVIASLSAYGHLLDVVGRQDEATKALDTALERARTVLGPKHPEVAGVLIHRSRLLAKQGKNTEALAVSEEARQLYEDAFGKAHANLGAVFNDEGLVLASLGRHEEALQKYQAAEPIIASAYGEENLQYAAVLVNVGHEQVQVGRAAEGVVTLERGAALRKRLLGAQSKAYAYALTYVGEARLELGQTAAAREAFAENVAVLTALHGEESDELPSGEIGLGDVAMIEGRPDEARGHYERALRLNGEPWHAVEGRARFGLARVELSEGDREAALAHAREARDLIARDLAASHYLAVVDTWLAEQR